MRQGGLFPSSSAAAGFLLRWALQLAACLLALALIYADGCASRAEEGAAVTAERCFEQYVPPQTISVAGRQVAIPGHYHNRLGRCAVCEAAVANSQPPPSAPASPVLPPQPAAPPMQAVEQPHADAGAARTAAELAALRRDVSREWKSLEARVLRIEQTLTAHAAALEAIVPAIERVEAQAAELRSDVGQLDGALERYATRVVAVEKTTHEERSRFRQRVREVVGSVAVVAAGEGSSAAPWIALAEGFGLGGPIGLGVVVGGMVLARALRRRASHSTGVAGGQGAPAADPFRATWSEYYIPAADPPPAAGDAGDGAGDAAAGADAHGE